MKEHSIKPLLWPLILAIVILLVAAICFYVANAEASSRYYDLSRIADWYVDSETGVVYFMIKEAQGLSNMMVICPRYMPDGSLYTVTWP